MSLMGKRKLSFHGNQEMKIVLPEIDGTPRKIALTNNRDIGGWPHWSAGIFEYHRSRWKMISFEVRGQWTEKRLEKETIQLEVHKHENDKWTLRSYSASDYRRHPMQFFLSRQTKPYRVSAALQSDVCFSFIECYFNAYAFAHGRLAFDSWYIGFRLLNRTNCLATLWTWKILFPTCSSTIRHRAEVTTEDGTRHVT